MAYNLYNYDPSIAAAAIMAVMFSITTLLHLFQMCATRTWFLIPFVLGGTFEIIGYVGRAISASQTPGHWTTGPYIVATLFILVAPALFAASIYMELGRLILLVDGDKQSIIRRTWQTKIFVAGDVLSFFTQGAGGGIMASGSASSMKTGQDVIVVGLFIQVLFFGFFLMSSTIFHVRQNKQFKKEKGNGEDLAVSNASSTTTRRVFQKHMCTLYATSILILIRSIFRIVEYLMGNTGYILSHEVFLYIFDAVLMLTTMVILNWIHPSEVKSLLRGGKSVKGGVHLVDMSSQV